MEHDTFAAVKGAPDEGRYNVALKGWLCTELEAGNLPTYGYPKNCLPKVKSGSMEIDCGFLRARNDISPVSDNK